jgi:hypothetical protein
VEVILRSKWMSYRKAARIVTSQDYGRGRRGDFCTKPVGIETIRVIINSPFQVYE